MNRVCEALGIEKPVIQAPMTWITSAELVAAVSNAGGLGILGFNAGFETGKATPEETAEAMRVEIRKTKALTDKPFGVNVMTAPIDGYGFSKATIAVACEEGVKALAAIGPIDAAQVAEWKKMGFKVKNDLWGSLSPVVEKTSEETSGVVCGQVSTNYPRGRFILRSVYFEVGLFQKPVYFRGRFI